MEQHSARILVVDDEAPIRLTLERLLRRRGYCVEVAGSGEAALELIGAQRFDLLLLDLKLPGIGGLEVARRARAAQPDAAVLLLTGQPAVDEAGAGEPPEPFAQIAKTASPQEVLARIAASVGR